MNRNEAIAEAQRLEMEAARLSAESHRLLRDADRLRGEHQNWLERQMASAEAEVACWPSWKLDHYRATYGE